MIGTRKVAADSTKQLNLSLSKSAILFAICGVVLVVLPSFVPPDLKSLLAKIMIFGILATSLNLLWGYTGLLSLGHASFYGVAGYTVVILMVRFDVQSFWITTIIGILAAALLAAILGIPALQVSGVRFTLVTIACGQLLFHVATEWRQITGGSSGLTGMPLPDTGLPFLKIDGGSFYYVVLVFFFISLFLMYRLTNSSFGLALQGIRENQKRMRALGYNTWLYQYVAYVVAALFAGVAGVLVVHYARVITPAHLSLGPSALAFLMVVLGSSSTFFGPVLGAGLVLTLEYFGGMFLPQRWPLILGGVFVASVMFLPGGVGVHLLKLWRRFFRGDA